jgi:predicted O-methyltransferase YrrM
MNLNKAVKFLLKNPISVLKKGILAQEEDNHKKCIQSKYGFEKLPTIDLLDLFPDLDENLDCYSFLNGTSLITDLILLKSLAKKQENCSYLEIGSWRGESLANVSPVSKKCVSVTLSEIQMREMNFDEGFIKVHGIFSKNFENIEFIGANSHDFDFNSLNQKFDLIFIDGDHSYKGVLNDTKKVFNLRKDSNSVIVWHDYAFNTEDTRHSVLEAILDGIPKEFHKNLYHVSNTMCAIYIENKNFETYFTKFPSYPNKKFRIGISAQKI